MKEADNQIDKKVTILGKRKILQEKVDKSQREYNKKKKKKKKRKERWEAQKAELRTSGLYGAD